MSTQIIEQSFQETTVLFQEDAYINATKAAKHFNKKVGDYLRLERTQEYINELGVAGYPVSKENQLVIMRKGGNAELQGTWLHPKLTIDFARWLSAKFAVWCDMQIEKILHPPRNALVELPPLTPKQQRHIQQRVKELVNTQVGVTYTSLWGGIKKQFDVGTYKDIPEVKYPELCQFLKCEPLQGELLPKETSPVTEAQTIQHLRDNGYLVAKANRHDLKKMTRDYIPLSLFNELIEVVNERMKETNHEGVFIKKSVLSGITKTVHCFGIICEGAMRDIEKVEEETGLRLYNRF